MSRKYTRKITLDLKKHIALFLLQKSNKNSRKIFLDRNKFLIFLFFFNRKKIYNYSLEFHGVNENQTSPTKKSTKYFSILKIKKKLKTLKTNRIQYQIIYTKSLLKITFYFAVDKIFTFLISMALINLINTKKMLQKLENPPKKIT